MATIPIEKQVEFKSPEPKQNVLYALFRDEHRTSELMYTHENDPSLIAQYNHWSKILEKWPDDTKLQILPVDHFYKLARAKRANA